jgi:hypothetical protein
MALFVKIALLSILTRIFAPYRGKVWFIYIFLGCLCCYYIVALIVKIRMCAPIPMYWLGPVEGGSCLDQAAALIADSVISVVSDIIILILPLPLTWSLQMSRNRKLRVMGLLGAGGLATGFSLYRLVLVLKDGNSPDISLMFVRVILSGYVMFARFPFIHVSNKKQKCRRRRRSNLRLSPNPQRPPGPLQKDSLRQILPTQLEHGPKRTRTQVRPVQGCLRMG